MGFSGIGINLFLSFLFQYHLWKMQEQSILYYAVTAMEKDSAGYHIAVLESIMIMFKRVIRVWFSRLPYFKSTTSHKYHIVLLYGGLTCQYNMMTDCPNTNYNTNYCRYALGHPQINTVPLKI